MRTWRLLGADGRPWDSPSPGTLGGHRGGRIYGRLDCAAARRAIHRGGYVSQRVFFADARAAIGAGYRPCAVCLPQAYARRKGLTAAQLSFLPWPLPLEPSSAEAPDAEAPPMARWAAAISASTARGWSPGATCRRRRR